MNYNKLTAVLKIPIVTTHIIIFQKIILVNIKFMYVVK